MGQYRPDYQVGRAAASGVDREADDYAEIGRLAERAGAELAAAYDAAREAGLWRFDDGRE